MSKLSRVFQNLFMANGSSSHAEQFGAKVQTGSAVPTLDPATIQAGAAFVGNGWLDAVVGTNKQPYLEDMNGLFVLLFRQLAYMFQSGIPEWDPATTYFTGSIVTAPGTAQLYASLVDNNTGNALPNQSNNASWQFLNPQADPPGIIKAYGLSMVNDTDVPGYLACWGVSHPNASYPNLSPLIPATWRTFNGAADPGAGNFRTPDFRSLTLMGAGQGTGFSARTLAQLVGEEAHTLAVSEIPPNLSVTDPGHVHNLFFGTPGGGDNNFADTFIPGQTNTSTRSNVTGISVGGGGAAHNNMQPSVGVNFLIKT